MAFGNRKQRRQPVSQLRELITMARSSESLAHIPDQFASIIQRYDQLDVDPDFRRDIHLILANAVALSEALIDETFPVDEAISCAAGQLEIVSRILLYLQRRPTKSGFSILIPETKMLVGQFATQEEAEDQIAVLKSLGSTAECKVVPVQVLSQHAIQPRSKSLPSPASYEEESIPPGIIPHQPPLQAEDADYREAETLQSQIDSLKEKP